MVKIRREFEMPLALGAACLLLALLLAAEWGYKTAAHRAVRERIDATTAPPESGDDAAANAYWLADAGHFEEIVQRPLFFQGRKVPVQAAAAPEAEKPFEAALHGVISAPDGTVLVLLKSNDGRHHRLHPHDLYSGWELAEVNPDRVFFTRGSERKELILQKPKPKDKPAAPDKQPPANQEQVLQEGAEVPQEEVKPE